MCVSAVRPRLLRAGLRRVPHLGHGARKRIGASLFQAECDGAGRAVRGGPGVSGTGVGPSWFGARAARARAGQDMETG